MSLNIIILAAGKGQRMASQMPKILHPLAGVPLLERVVNTAQALNPNAIHVVYGNGGNKVREVLKHLSVNWIEQKEQLGTGHAVLQALPYCDDADRVLILYGDVPLISVPTLKKLLDHTPADNLGLMVADFEDPTGLGRIIRNKENNIIHIVEHKDADAQQLKICEINTGIMTAPAAHLKSWLPKLTNTNKQKEYYLTDIISLAVADRCAISGVTALESEEVQGVNDRWELMKLERYYQRCAAKNLALSGVTISDPARLDLRSDDIEIEEDVTIDINVILEGKIRIGKNSHIGPNVFLKNVIIGENVNILANSVIEDTTIANDCSIGPFARLRPGTVLAQRVKVGNFIEIKKTTLGSDSKVPHLTYLGDAVIGSQVNIGAGTITCNYDGANKWQTTIEDQVFIGSNTSLVAPVTIRKGATIGAGSTITADAPAEQLTLARSTQKTVRGWQRTKKRN